MQLSIKRNGDKVGQVPMDKEAKKLQKQQAKEAKKAEKEAKKAKKEQEKKKKSPKDKKEKKEKAPKDPNAPKKHFLPKMPGQYKKEIAELQAQLEAKQLELARTNQELRSKSSELNNLRNWARSAPIR